MEQLGTMLGTNWDLESMRSKSGPGNKDKILIPLSAAINPSIIEHVQRSLGIDNDGKKVSRDYIGQGEHIPTPGEKVQSLGSMNKDEFMDFLRSAGVPGVIPRQPGE